MYKRTIISHLCAASVLLLPALALAHGGVEDGHVEDALPVVDVDGHKAGSSELLVAWSARWWGIMAVAVILMSALSYGVWKYLRVEIPKPSAVSEKKT